MRTFTISKVGKSAYDYHRYLFVCEVKIRLLYVWKVGQRKMKQHVQSNTLDAVIDMEEIKKEQDIGGEEGGYYVSAWVWQKCLGWFLQKGVRVGFIELGLDGFYRIGG